MNTIERAPAWECQGAVMPAVKGVELPSQNWLTLKEATQALGMSFGQVAALIEVGVIVPLEAAWDHGSECPARSGGWS